MFQGMREGRRVRNCVKRRTLLRHRRKSQRSFGLYVRELSTPWGPKLPGTKVSVCNQVKGDFRLFQGMREGRRVRNCVKRRMLLRHRRKSQRSFGLFVRGLSTPWGPKLPGTKVNENRLK